ncbi:hypothetical protein Y032_0050g1916 [Ancylostoma ceylanicum]|uniref:Uncharacterized protein n=1 Tax=Ancylostoma ceylanicum TaxID=53326 RepID=A0A016U802_9BILA|nr:hypothetical protein Y032_0050g1916 [Ancylostoma ceylanicum]
MPSSLSGDELARLERELLGDRNNDKPGEEESPDKPSETRKRRRRESSSSVSSSHSTSESSTSSDYSSESDNDDDIRKRGTEERKKKFFPPSPLEESSRIPRRIDFAGAVKVAPEIARIEFKKLRTRVDIDPKLLDHFNKCAAGMIQVDEASLVADAEVLLNALNLMAISRNEAHAGRHERADLYIEQAMEVLAFGVEANVTRRRERFLRSFGVEPLKVVPNFHRFPVEEPARSADLPWNEVCPALMGTKLTTEIVEKSQCRKLTEALVKEAKSKRRETHIVHAAIHSDVLYVSVCFFSRPLRICKILAFSSFFSQ